MMNYCKTCDFNDIDYYIVHQCKAFMQSYNKIEGTSASMHAYYKTTASKFVKNNTSYVTERTGYLYCIKLKSIGGLNYKLLPVG